MRTLLAALTALMLFATPVVAGDVDDEAIQRALEAAKAELAVRVAAQRAFDERNFPKAFRLNKPLAEQGVAEAQVLLGIMYLSGRGVPKDYAEAADWFRKAAEQGYANCAVQPRLDVPKGQRRP